jgi:putative flippase GtrA
MNGVKMRVGKLVSYRLAKFGAVGCSGVIVNLSVLFVGQEYIFRWVTSVGSRLNISLGFAILIATLSNFTLNRSWTWSDRKYEGKRVLIQLGKYFAACWLAISIQIFATKILSHFIHYLLANVSAIGFSSLVNFLMNDSWTFSRERFQGLGKGL